MTAALLLLWLPACPAANDAKLPEACTNDCATPYGEVLGNTGSQVKAYSNCNEHCVVVEPNTVDGVYTGIKWQCVEFARRWLLLNKSVVFDEVVQASDIWDTIEHVTRIEDGQLLWLDAYANGSDITPKVGDLLVYSNDYLGTGHVAVVTAADTDLGFVSISEQNYHNATWADRHARQIRLQRIDGRIWLRDPYLIGWKRVVDEP